MNPAQQTAQRLVADDLATRGRRAGWPTASLTHDGARWVAKLADGQSTIEAPHGDMVVAVETALLIAGAS